MAIFNGPDYDYAEKCMSYIYLGLHLKQIKGFRIPSYRQNSQILFAAT